MYVKRISQSYDENLQHQSRNLTAKAIKKEIITSLNKTNKYLR